MKTKIIMDLRLPMGHHLVPRKLTSATTRPQWKNAVQTFVYVTKKPRFAQKFAQHFFIVSVLWLRSTFLVPNGDSLVGVSP